MKKILIVSTVSRQFYLFEQGNIQVLKSLGYEIHCAANFSDANERLDTLDIIRHPFDIQRSPFSLTNIKAYKQLKAIMKSGDYDIVHCHSPMGGVLARLAAKTVGIKRVLYTAHGFHFFKGAPLLNWLLFYPAEKHFSKYTDVLVTINHEDYERAKNKFHAKKVVYVPGIGINTERFKINGFDRDKKRKELRIPNNSTVLLSVGEMIKRKNHILALKALSRLKRKDYIYLICGRGELEGYLKHAAASLGIENNVRFLGFRSDVAEICLASDIFVFPSFQEGLPVAVMEAMSAGLPIICSNIRGNVELIKNRHNGFLLNTNDIDGFTRAIDKLIESPALRKQMGAYNSEIVKNYDTEQVKRIMEKTYRELE